MDTQTKALIDTLIKKVEDLTLRVTKLEQPSKPAPEPPKEAA